MMSPKLTDHFRPGACKELQRMYGVTTVKEAQSLTDDQILLCRGLGKIFLHKLRSIKSEGDQEIESLYKMLSRALQDLERTRATLNAVLIRLNTGEIHVTYKS